MSHCRTTESDTVIMDRGLLGSADVSLRPTVVRQSLIL